MNCGMGSAKHQKSEAATQSVISGNPEAPILYICNEHARKLQKLPPPHVPKSGDCERCLARPGERDYPLGAEKKRVCDACWLQLTGRGFGSTEKWRKTAREEHADGRPVTRR